MIVPGLERVLAAPDAEVEPLIRSARAEMAMLSLRLRTTIHAAEQLEAELDDNDESDERALLEMCLAEVVESRRRDVEERLEEARLEAARAVDAAREATRHRGTEHRETDDVEPDAVEPDAVVAKPKSGAAEPAPGTAEPAASAALVPAADTVAQLVQAAVAAAVSQVVQSMRASDGMAAPIHPHPPVTPHAEQPATEAVSVRRRSRSLRRSLLHVDVLLPMALVVIVFVVLIAWVG